MDKIIAKTNFKIKDYHEIIEENGIKWLVYVLKKWIKETRKIILVFWYNKIR